MSHALAALLLALAGADPVGNSAAARPLPAAPVEGAPDTEVIRLASADDVVKLCRALDPPERLRARGDAVALGEATQAHERARDDAIVGRYELRVPAAKLAFAPYDAAERRLLLDRGGLVPLDASSARLWPTEAAGLPVEVDGAAARRILEAQAAGALELALVFDLPDDVACGGVSAGKASPTLPVEPVSWTWSDGARVLARGGAGEDRPLVTAAQGASPRVAVGDPVSGPRDGRNRVLRNGPALEACYAEALRRDPAVDGVLVAELGGVAPAIAADSVGDVELSACVRRALSGAAGAGGTVAVPIRFELVAPAQGSAAPPAR